MSEKPDEYSRAKSDGPPPVAVLSSSSRPDDRRRRRGWRTRRARSEDPTSRLPVISGSAQAVRHTQSQMVGPFSPGSGSSAGLSVGLVSPASGDRPGSIPVSSRYLPPAVAVVDPLIRHGAIVRPPLSPQSPLSPLGTTRQRLPSSPGLDPGTDPRDGQARYRRAGQDVGSGAVVTDDNVDIFDVLFNGPAPGHAR